MSIDENSGGPEWDNWKMGGGWSKMGDKCGAKLGVLIELWDGGPKLAWELLIGVL